MIQKTLFTLAIIAIFGINLSTAQTIFFSQQEVVEYLEGDWNLDVVQGGFAGGPYYLPSPFYYDSTVHKIVFESTEIDSTPLICKAFIDDTLYQETYVTISQNPSQIILPRWLLSNLPDNLDQNNGLAEDMGFYGFSQDTIVFSGNIAADGFEYGLTRLIASTEELVRQEDVNIYPNPSDGRIFIEGIELNTPYRLFDIEGRLIKSGVMNDNNLNLEGRGINVLKLYIRDRWVSKKIVIEE